MNFELDIDDILLEDCNSSFMKYFDIQNFSIVCEKNDLNDFSDYKFSTVLEKILDFYESIPNNKDE